MRAFSKLCLFAILVGNISASEFWKVEIELGQNEIAALTTAPRAWVTARATFNKGSAVPVRLKLKGRGTFQPLNEKPSFTMEVAARQREQLPYSSTKIHLNNSADDATYLKEKLGSEMFNQIGIPTPRVGHARVTLNERELGLYVLKEGFDEKFARRELGEGAAIYDRDPETGGGLDLDAGEDRRERVKLLGSAAEADIGKRFEQLREVLDVEAFAKFLAMEVLICHWDGYALSENNFRIAVRADGKIHFLPAGMDQIFSIPNFTWLPAFSGSVAKRFMEMPEGRERYRIMLEKLLSEFLGAERLSNRLEQLSAALEADLTRAERSQIRAEAKELSARIAARETSLKEQLKQTETKLLQFANGTAVVSNWQPMDQPEGGSMGSNDSTVAIVAGPRTSASWAAKVLLLPGRYTFATTVKTEDVSPLPFGTRQGACLRVLGRSAHSQTLVGSTSSVLRCSFELPKTEEITLLLELRASAGKAEFNRQVELRPESGIPAKKK
ncbi:MAG TPA: CotH kinase family protein [Verrucomicrobiae bacterium]